MEKIYLNTVDPETPRNTRTQVMASRCVARSSAFVTIVPGLMASNSVTLESVRA